MTKGILLQGVTEDSHLDAVKYILGIPFPQRVIMSVAFMNESGLSIIEEGGHGRWLHRRLSWRA